MSKDQTGERWALALAANRALGMVTPAEALERIERALTDENDCSMFLLTVSGGADPVSVPCSPDAVRRILITLDLTGGEA